MKIRDAGTDGVSCNLLVGEWDTALFASVRSFLKQLDRVDGLVV